MTADPEKFVTYKRADGEMVDGQFGWVAHLEFFDDEAGDHEGVRIVKEVWALVTREEIHLHPDDCFWCDKPWHGPDYCEDDPEEGQPS